MCLRHLLSARHLSPVIGVFFLLASCGMPSQEPIPLGFDENSWTNPQPQDLASDGEPCADDAECLGGTCLTGADWPSGYCTTRDCNSNNDCAGEPGSVTCHQHPEEGAICGTLCSAIDPHTCRGGYGCDSIGGATGWCMQRDSPFSNEISLGPDFPFPMTCVTPTNRIAALDFEIAPTTTSYMIVPVASNLARIQPHSIELPSGASIDLQGPNHFQVSSFSYFGINPFIVPVAPQFSSQLEHGPHTLRLTTGDSEVCYYLLEAQGQPKKLDLNFYFVGLEHLGLNASTASEHQAFRQLLGQTNRIYAQAGISIGKTRFFDVEPAVASKYRIIRDDNSLHELLAHSDYPGTTEDDALSINVFITSRITHGPLGVSIGAPGVPGVHGTILSGVVISGEYLEYENGGSNYTAVVLAHETGHFVGLEHTSEIGGNEFDFLQDTPECRNFNMERPWHCPDWGNLMFPLAGPQNTSLSPGQNHVLQVSPLTK